MKRKQSPIVVHHGDCLALLARMRTSSVHSLVTDPPAGIGFMGKAWDHDKGGRDQWIAWLTKVMRECHRVLKPGAHGLVWALPRTSHWTATALENAGFEIRDVVTHLFGTGFPKSMDISKAIDKAAGAEREVVGINPSSRPNSKTKGGRGFDGDLGGEPAGVQSITAPSTEAAKKWQGYGTALKPASEHWILIRKPLSEKTVAANVLKHGTGGINIDASRIGIATDDPIYAKNPHTQNTAGPGFAQGGGGAGYTVPTGRFPANLVLSHNEHCILSFGDRHNVCSETCPRRMLDEQSGERGASGKSTGAKSKGSTFSQGSGQVDAPFYGDSGGASRFFYVAKASKADKGADNTHPTVKSTALMEYLIKLVTPEGGVVLDPFAGSGSTGIAALKGGFRFVGMERDRAYFKIASKRLQGKKKDVASRKCS